MGDGPYDYAAERHDAEWAEEVGPYMRRKNGGVDPHFPPHGYQPEPPTRNEAEADDK